MPRPKNAESAEPKKRSRTGCWPCKARKVKCGEEKPQCVNCVKTAETCDYSIRLNWGGRTKKGQGNFTFSATPAPSTPASPARSSPQFKFEVDKSPTGKPSTPNGKRVQRADTSMIDPQSTGNGNTFVGKVPQEQPWYRGLSTSHQYQTAPTAQMSSINQSLPRLPGFAQFQSFSDFSEESRNGVDMSNGYQDSFQSVDPGLDASTMEQDMQLPPLTRPDMQWSPQHGAKRQRLSPAETGRFALPKPMFAKPSLPDSTHSPRMHLDQPSPGSNFASYSLNSAFNTPMTPGSSIASEETHNKPLVRSGLSVQESPDLRRLSVNSLLSGPPGAEDSSTITRSSKSSRYPRSTHDGYTVYGYDHGLPDLDIPKNDDANSIGPHSPTSLRTARPSVSELPTSGGTTPEHGTGGAQAVDIAFERGGYYAEPVPVKISCDFDPLPEYLTENPMNLLYFHHFLNHTARILVPHDCPDNPLRSIFPQMAVRNANLLNLLLAYSASHRARLLDQPEPGNRIALWVRDVFPDLRASLSSPEPVSDATLGQAIMLASLEIVSPNTFDVPITWQNHLQIARQIIISRGGLNTLSKKGDKYLAFFCKWFAYLEVLGSLGGNKSGEPLAGDYWTYGDEAYEHNFQVDCFLGFTTRCISLLAQVAKFAHTCDAQRITANGDIRSDWHPSSDTVQAADKLKLAIEQSRQRMHEGCTHSNPHEPTEDKSPQDIREILASNEMFHWAGLIHLYRRVLGRPSHDPDVQGCVGETVAALARIRRGSTMESCLLFPMFTAGCDAREQDQRDRIMERLKGVEGWGMPHVLKARTLMQKVWDTGKPWETLVAGEFFG